MMSWGNGAGCEWYGVMCHAAAEATKLATMVASKQLQQSCLCTYSMWVSMWSGVRPDLTQEHLMLKASELLQPFSAGL